MIDNEYLTRLDTLSTTTLVDKGTDSASSSISGALGASASTTQAVSLTLPTANVTGLYRVKVMGTGDSSIDDYWYVHQGYTAFPLLAQYKIEVYTKKTATTLDFYFRATNRTGAGITLPTLTLNTYAHFYGYPWTT